MSSSHIHILTIFLPPFADFTRYARSWTTMDSNAPQKRFACDICGKMYLLKRSVRNHQNFECGQPRQFACDQCGYRFMYKHHLQRHIAKKHPNVVKQSNSWDQVPSGSQFAWNMRFSSNTVLIAFLLSQRKKGCAAWKITFQLNYISQRTSLLHWFKRGD